MALDLNALASGAFKTALGIAPQAFRKATVRLGPTPGAYDPATDTTSGDSWAIEGTDIDALKYDDENQREDQPLEAKMATFLVDINDLPGATDATLQQDGTVTENGVEWECYRAEIDPSKSIVQLHCRR